MKKILLSILILLTGFTMVGCNKKDKPEEVTPPIEEKPEVPETPEEPEKNLDIEFPEGASSLVLTQSDINLKGEFYTIVINTKEFEEFELEFSTFGTFANLLTIDTLILNEDKVDFSEVAKLAKGTKNKADGSITHNEKEINFIRGTYSNDTLRLNAEADEGSEAKLSFNLDGIDEITLKIGFTVNGIGFFDKIELSLK